MRSAEIKYLMLLSTEAKHILISWVVLSIAFAWTLHFTDFLTNLPFYLIAVGTAFVLHELAHKYSAVRLGYHAEYRLWEYGLLLALAVAVFTGGRFVFAAPGAVYVLGVVSRRDNGLISLSGPLANLTVAYLSLFLALSGGFSTTITTLFLFLAAINGYIGFFNMLPIPPLDGSKVIAWNPVVWGLMFVALLPFVILV